MDENDVPNTKHRLSGSNFLKAFPLDKSKTPDNIKSMLEEVDGKFKAPDLGDLRKKMHKTDEFPSLNDVRMIISNVPYEVPEVLKPFRQEGGRIWLEKGWKDRKVFIPQGKLVNPFDIKIGTYFDFKATHLNEKPADILPGMYPEGKNIRGLMQDYNLKLSNLGRYLGVCHLLYTSGGEEISFVQRAKGLAMVADCMAFSGCTPNFTDNMYDKNFNFGKFLTEFVTGMMQAEYSLMPNEVKIRNVHVIDDTFEVPCLVTEIVTPVSLAEIAGRCGDRQLNNEDLALNQPPIKQHTVLYSIPANAESIDNLVKRFPIYVTTANLMDSLVKPK